MDEGRQRARQTKIQDSKRKEEKRQEKNESPIDSLRWFIFYYLFFFLSEYFITLAAGAYDTKEKKIHHDRMIVWYNLVSQVQY